MEEAKGIVITRRGQILHVIGELPISSFQSFQSSEPFQLRLKSFPRFAGKRIAFTLEGLLLDRRHH